ncbi:hypothetical protein B0H14DRAFT_2650602 [Mycena olivaceomarginata]|nr:hypothetical protein B0H14DRAFT_2650602 [Mycena olivaceomarginata]
MNGVNPSGRAEEAYQARATVNFDPNWLSSIVRGSYQFTRKYPPRGRPELYSTAVLNFRLPPGIVLVLRAVAHLPETRVRFEGVPGCPENSIQIMFVSPRQRRTSVKYLFAFETVWPVLVNETHSDARPRFKKLEYRSIAGVDG